MKDFLKKILLLLPLFLSANYLSTYQVINNKLSVRTICKNGFLTDVISGKIKDVNITVEQPTCIDVSSWDNLQCNHKPIKCKK